MMHKLTTNPLRKSRRPFPRRTGEGQDGGIFARANKFAPSLTLPRSAGEGMRAST
jgi:hypothetical protein